MNISIKSYSHLAGRTLLPWYAIDIEYDAENNSKTVVFRSRIHESRETRTTFEWSGTAFSDLAILNDPLLLSWVTNRFGRVTQKYTYE